MTEKIRTKKNKSKKRVYTRKKYIANKDPAFNQGILINYYICSSLNVMLNKFNTKADKKRKLLEIVKYSFSDVDMKKIRQLSNILYNCSQNKKSDAEIIYIIVDWYRTLKKKNKVPFALSYNEYIEQKINEAIKNIDDKENIKRKIILDIGAGDCALTRQVGKALHMTPVAVDVKDDIDWGGANLNKCKLTKIYYDGSKLTDVMRELDKRFKNKPRIGCVMYNHSLHHFGSISNIEKSLEQSYKLLDKNGYLLIREHNNENNDISINLQHIFIALRYMLDAHPEWTGRQLLEYYRYFMIHYTSHFFSKKFLIKYCKKLGYKLIGYQKRIVPKPVDYNAELSYGLNPSGDVSKTVLFTFKKV